MKSPKITFQPRQQRVSATKAEHRQPSEEMKLHGAIESGPTHAPFTQTEVLDSVLESGEVGNLSPSKAGAKRIKAKRVIIYMSVVPGEEPTASIAAQRKACMDFLAAKLPYVNSRAIVTLVDSEVAQNGVLNRDNLGQLFGEVYQKTVASVVVAEALRFSRFPAEANAIAELLEKLGASVFQANVLPQTRTGKNPSCSSISPYNNRS